jgi:hypothetical protein
MIIIACSTPVLRIRKRLFIGIARPKAADGGLKIDGPVGVEKNGDPDL